MAQDFGKKLNRRFQDTKTKLLNALISGRSKYFHKLVLPAFLLVPAVAFLGYKVYSTWGNLDLTRWHWNPWYLVVAMLPLLISFLLNALIWSLLVQSHGATSNFKENLRIFALSGVARHLPGSIWQIAGRTFLYHQEGVPAPVPLQSSIWEIIIQILSALIVFTAFLPCYSSVIPQIVTYIWVLLLLFLPFIAIPSLLQRTFELLSRLFFHRQSQSKRLAFSIRHKNVLIWLLLYILSWLNGGLILYLLLKSFYVGVPSSLLPALCGFVALSGATGICVSAIPGGLGLRELSLSTLLSNYLPDPISIAAAVLFRLWIGIVEIGYAFLTLFILYCGRKDYTTNGVLPK